MNLVAPLVADRASGFLGWATDAHSREILAAAAMGRGWGQVEILAGGIAEAHACIAGGRSPAFMVIDLSGHPEPLAAVDALAEISTADMRVLAIGTANSVALFRSLRTLGVADYLVKPLDRETLGAAFSALDETQRARRATPQKAEVIGFIGSRGGAGATSIALSMAHLLTRRANARGVTFLDLDLQAGSAGLDIGADVSPGLAALIQSPDRLDQALIDAALKNHRLGFHLLSAEEPLDRPISIKPEAIQALLAAVSDAVDFILVDMPRRLDRPGRALLRLADRVVIVTPMTLAGMRETQRLCAFVTGVRAGQAPLILANRTGETGAEVPLREFERAAGTALAAMIPYQPKLAAQAMVRASTLSAVAPVRSDMARALGRAVDALAAPLPVANERAGWPDRLKRFLLPGRVGAR